MRSAKVTRGKTGSGSLGAFVLQSDGRVLPVNISEGPWSASDHGDREIEITAAGVIVSTNASSLAKNSPAGIYLLTNNLQNIKLDSGITGNLAISPNGCEIAYLGEKPEPGDRLNTINLCSLYNIDHETNQRASPERRIQILRE